MIRIALLISENLLPGPDQREDAFEYEEQIGKLGPAFAKLGLSLEPVLWQEFHKVAHHYTLAMPLMIWDYAQGKYDAFLSEMERIGQLTTLRNSARLIRWNSDKSYLEDLYARGAPVIPSQTVETVTKESVEAAFNTFKTERLVVKPCIGAGAWRQFSLKRGEDLPPLAQRPPGRALIQPFQTAVQKEGEYSLLFFDGIFSHGLVKRPEKGDYRVQSLYGGWDTAYQPDSAMIALAQKILTYLDEVPLYARLDLLRGNDGELKLIEFELIEPYLYLTMAKGDGAKNHGAQALAASVFKRLSHK